MTEARGPRGRAASGEHPSITTLGEVVVVWALVALLVGAVFVTYWRLPSGVLYNTSVEGLAGGAGRALVQTNFPSVSLVAIALTLVALAVLPRTALWLAVPSIALCLVTARPGQVRQSDLDARLVNALPALGVLLAAVLTVWAVRRAGVSFAPALPGDRARVVVAAVVLVLSVPWLAAEAGYYLGNGVFLTSRVVTEGDETLPAVHLGHHHGLDGTVLVLFALLLSRIRVAPPALATTLLLYVSLMLGYGFVNSSEDFWHEQVVKRGWIDWKIPAALLPRFHWIWLVTLGLTAIAFLVFRVERRVASSGDNPAA